MQLPLLGNACFVYSVETSVANFVDFVSERQTGAALSVQIDDVASLILHADIAENTAQELSLLMLCVFDFFAD